MNPVQEVARLRQEVLYSNGTLQLPHNSSGGGLQVCASQALLRRLVALRFADKLVHTYYSRDPPPGQLKECPVPTANTVAV